MIVEKINSNKRNTKYGIKDAWSFLADGEWYSTGFKKPSIAVGDVIDLPLVESTPYGKQVDVGNINVLSIVASTPSAGVAPPPATRMERKMGKFPIEFDDGQRAIVRQNALTNACNFYAKSRGEKGFAIDIAADAGTIVALARAFEAYSCGDLDVAQAKQDILEGK